MRKKGIERTERSEAARKSKALMAIKLCASMEGPTGKEVPFQTQRGLTGEILPQWSLDWRGLASTSETRCFHDEISPGTHILLELGSFLPCLQKPCFSEVFTKSFLPVYQSGGSCFCKH
jgi:hypothetical protein